ncbi:ABC transporter ATP-binding protein [Falsiroseomonas selenitidurans]|nr:ABC transporter ATP-binding protein [Falsiroseomonas selenitidurans]
MSVAIRLAGCGRTWPGGSIALHPLDLDIAAGETLVLLGPSGCGKTTLLRLIAGLEAPDAGGRVFFDGEDVTRLPIERRHVGMVFQSYALFPNMDVAGNIGYGLRVRGVARAAARRRVDEMLAMMRLDGLGGRRIEALSGGQRQRVALARAIAPRPRVLLLDEPLSALDARLREQLRQEIDALLRSLGITAVYVTHDQAEAMALGDRIAAMEKGRIAQIGTGRDLYHRPANDFVAGFVGDTNRLATPEGERLVRPEHLALRRSATGGFTVVQATFLGPVVRVLLRDAAGRELRADVPDEDVPAPGERVAVLFQGRSLETEAAASPA